MQHVRLLTSNDVVEIQSVEEFVKQSKMTTEQKLHKLIQLLADNDVLDSEDVLEICGAATPIGEVPKMTFCE